MAAPKSSISLPLPLALLFVLLFSFNSGRTLKRVNAQKYWCVVKPSSDDRMLQNNIDWACKNVDCHIIQEGSPCFTPDNLMNHASVIMNVYYRAAGGNPWDCDWAKSGLIVITDPSYGDCKYA